MPLILLSRDLMLVSRLEGVVRKHDLALCNATDVMSALEEANQPAAIGLIVDLRFPGLQIEELASAVQTHHPTLPIIASGPHVHEAQLERARRAGCDQVLSRGQLDRSADAIVAELVQQHAR